MKTVPIWCSVFFVLPFFGWSTLWSDDLLNLHFTISQARQWNQHQRQIILAKWDSARTTQRAWSSEVCRSASALISVLKSSPLSVAQMAWHTKMIVQWEEQAVNRRNQSLWPTGDLVKVGYHFCIAIFSPNIESLRFSFKPFLYRVTQFPY